MQHCAVACFVLRANGESQEAPAHTLPVVTRIDTLKAGWTPMYITQRYTLYPQHAIELHEFKLLISLVLVTCTTYFFSGIGALLCHHPYCFPSQSETFFGIGAGQLPSPTWTFPLQHKPSPSNINHPPTKKRKSTQSSNCNMGVAQDIVQSLTWRTRNDRLSDKKTYKNVLSTFLLMCFDLETLKPAL